MSIIKYEVKTRSGKVYLVEDHTHLLGRPTWYLDRGGIKYLIHVLIPVEHRIYGMARQWFKGATLPESYFKDKEFMVRPEFFKGRIIVASDTPHPNDKGSRYVSSQVVEFEKME